MLLPTASEKTSVLVFSVEQQFAGISRFKRGNKTACSQNDLAFPKSHAFFPLPPYAKLRPLKKYLVDELTSSKAKPN